MITDKEILELGWSESSDISYRTYVLGGYQLDYEGDNDYHLHQVTDSPIPDTMFISINSQQELKMLMNMIGIAAEPIPEYLIQAYISGFSSGFTASGFKMNDKGVNNYLDNIQKESLRKIVSDYNL